MIKTNKTLQMNVNIIRSEFFDLAIYERLECLLKPFSTSIKFIFHSETFEEPNSIWNRNLLIQSIGNYRNLNGINKNDFVIFLTTQRDSENWFSACLQDWEKNIFVSTIEWKEDCIIEIEKIEYPIAYQIIENLFQYLTSNNFQEYCSLGHETIGCINDMCENKTDIIFKLRTADICRKCQSLAEKRIETNYYDQMIEILENIRFQFLHNKRNFTIFQSSFNRAKLEYLKEIKDFINDNLHQNESKIQNWLDEDNGKYRKQRCLIFGMDYIDPKREGEIHMRKRFDILAEQNLENHVIIELKSPSAGIFKVVETENKNSGKTTEYSISPELSRAIPQILSYKRQYEQMSEEEVQAIGINQKRSVSECIIVIGQRKDNDKVWKQHFNDLQKSINVKILTYNDLIDKMNNTILNLDNLLKN
jgi:hypothetical protein